MKIRTLLSCSLLWIACSPVYATTYSLPLTIGDAVVTQYPDDVALTQAQQDETLLDVARRFLLGQTEVVRINPDMDRWKVKKGEIVRLPNKRILPDTPHKGITLNISEYRMYVYPPDQPGTVMSFAHGIGRQDWKTPLGQTKVARKIKDPSWHPPESIRREHAAMGDPLPEIVPPGPHNPLGAYALYLALPGEYRIHGTDIDKIYGIGMQITHGCVRMYPEDIEQLYNVTPVGTPVYIVKQSIKVGWLDNNLYVEAHPDLEGEEMSQDQRYAVALDLIQKANNHELPEFDQAVLNEVLTKLDGEPRAIFERLPPLEGELQQQAMPEPQPLPVPVKPLATAKPKPVKKAVATKATKPVQEKKLAASKKTPPVKKPLALKGKPDKPLTAKKPAVKQAPIKQASAKTQPSKRQGSPGGYYRGF